MIEGQQNNNKYSDHKMKTIAWKWDDVDAAGVLPPTDRPPPSPHWNHSNKHAAPCSPLLFRTGSCHYCRNSVTQLLSGGKKKKKILAANTSAA